MAYNDRNTPPEDGEDRPLLLSRHSDDVLIVDPDVEFGGKKAREVLERNLLRKVDRRMSILVLIYILNYIDRNNASAARLRGFEEDLNLQGTQFATILSVLYIGYIIMQIPSNMFLDYIGKPSLYLPVCMIVWGGISVMTGFTTNFFGAVCTRFFLGFVEAAFFPGALFLISKWYKRTELSQRTALLACGILVSNAFGSLIASAILDSMEGRLGYAAWRWLFFIEGGLTVIVAICAIFILPDFPETSFGWLTPAEQALAQKRMQEDHGSVEDKTEPTSGLQLALTDGKVWWLAITLISINVSLSFNAFFPTLMSTLGYSATITLLLCVPPWVFATVVAVYLSRHSDHSGERFWHLSGSFLLGILGFLLAMSTMNVAVRYVSLFFQAQSYAGFICFFAWSSGSVARPPAKRAVALALINTVGSLGNISGSYLWPKSWEPTYSKSFTVCVLASALALTMCWLFKRHLAALNAREEKREVEMGSDRGYRISQVNGRKQVTFMVGIFRDSFGSCLTIQILVNAQYLAMNSAEYVRGEITFLFESLPGGKTANDVWAEVILEKYSEPHRHYHTLTHLEAMIRCLRENKGHIHDPTSLSLAILFHDIIYDPQGQNNEILSMKKFEKFAMDKGLPAEQTSKVSCYIERTITHTLPEEAEEGNSSDLHFFLDFDLEVLSRPADAYRTYASQIRKEYSHVPMHDYRAGRVAVLQKFLAREKIYFSQVFHTKHEAAARRNLQQEIHVLTSD